ncbi:anthranilate synthase component I [Kitasatospora sp. NPDC056651]|uniref:anthranilate synthase component I n=1 Tax=Kitasatospora sp. NPDC056651 TaxID=3345892 RepID=UPI0036CE7E22
MTILETERRPADSPVDRASWTTPAGVTVTRATERRAGARAAMAELTRALDQRRGLLVHRGPHRAVGYVDPPVELALSGDELTVSANNARGLVLLGALRTALTGVLTGVTGHPEGLTGRVPAPAAHFAEEERTRQAGAFRAVRAVLDAMASPADRLLGLYGAFGYDLAFRLEPIELCRPRQTGDRDLVLQLPDQIHEFDLESDELRIHRYEFAHRGLTTPGLPGTTAAEPFTPGVPELERDHPVGGYAEVVRRAMPLFRSGDLFEVVPGQVFHRPCPEPPSRVFARLYAGNPAPHSLLANLGRGEYLVGASPERFVRVRPDEAHGLPRTLVESSPISGTIARGRDALEDADRIRELLGSVKEESELTMCTDVDRNDKARVCVPGTVRVTERRRIELYSTLIHTVDRVEGELRPDRDALDAFLTHLWAVTVTGAPKLPAMQFIERTERSPRRWYGGAVGQLGFDGGLDTVLTLRTIQIRDGVATVRAGATLLHDSRPEAEEAETELKAAALLRALEGPAAAARAPRRTRPALPGRGKRILLVDHRDSFVHCLADYLRQTGAEVATYRSGRHLDVLERERPDLLVLSPGPGRPGDFDLGATLAAADRLDLPVLGVCLGLQALGEHFGATLETLDRPVHGKASRVTVTVPGSRLLAGLPPVFEVGRYHSLHVAAGTLPAELLVTARTDDGVVMALEHRHRPLAAVQFHPESIMTAKGAVGRRIIENAVTALTAPGPGTAPGPSTDGEESGVRPVAAQRTP